MLRVFDAAFLVALLIALLNALRARVWWAAVLGSICIASLIILSTAALASRTFEGALVGAMGVIFLGPTAVATAGTGVLNSLSGSAIPPIFWILCCIGGMVVCRYRTRDMHPDTEGAQPIFRAEVSFVGAGIFAMIRLSTFLFFLWL